MADASEPSETPPEYEPGDGDGGDGDGRERGGEGDEQEDPETLRRRVEAKYDFSNFTPADMAEMTVEEWEAAFDANSWITGPELLDRVEADLRSRVARREVFAVVERTERSGTEYVLAYTDAGYALVAPDGTVEGEGSIVEDVEPVVALCSMEDYEVSEPPADAGLPHPDDVSDGASGLGDRLLLAIAGAQVVAGLFLLVSPVLFDIGGGGSALLTTVVGLAFVFIGVVIGVLVANARLSGRFRAEEYRERLRAAGVGTDERPAFLPDEEAFLPGKEALRPDQEAAGTADATGAETGADPANEGSEGGADERAEGEADESAESAPD